MRLGALLFLLPLALGATGCGDGESDAAGPGPWSSCRLTGVSGLSGACAIGDDLLFCAGGGSKQVHIVSRADLVDGGAVTPRVLDVKVSEGVRIVGRELLARRGYTLGTLWNAGVDFRGIAWQAPDFLFLADAAFRVVYWGRVVRDMDGRLSSVTLQHVFEVPGALRTGQDQADYRDLGPGIAGAFGVSGRQRTEDLYLVERAWSRATSDRGDGGEEEERATPTRFRVLVLDRFGSLGGGGGGDLGYFVVEAGGPPEIAALAWDRENERFLCVRGTGRGSLHAFTSPGSMRTGKLGQPIPGPDVPGAGSWGGFTVAPGGAWILASDGDPAVVAWRTP